MARAAFWRLSCLLLAALLACALTGEVALLLSRDDRRPLRLRASTGRRSTSDRTIDPGDAGVHHIVFTSGCSPQQNWQALALLESALGVGQDRSSVLTRIASGCSPAARAEVVRTAQQVPARTLANPIAR